MRILITGGAGFVGSNIANKLHTYHNVTVVDNLSFGYRDNLNKGVKFIYDQFQDIDVSNYDLLIHCATANIIYSQNNPIDTFKTNAHDTIKLFERFTGPIIYTSTASVYGNARTFPITESEPTKTYNAYDQSKLIAELYLQLRGNFTILRLSNVYGTNQRPENPYSGVICKFIEAVKNDMPIIIYGDGKDTRDYTNVSDVVSAVEKVIDRGVDNEIYNISAGEETRIDYMAMYISALANKKYNVVYEEPRKIDGIKRRWLSNYKAISRLGWRPEIYIKDGLKLVLFS